MDIFKVYATGQKTRKDGTKAIARKRWIASFLLETDAHVYAESVRRYNPTWQVEIRFPNVNYDGAFDRRRPKR